MTQAPTLANPSSLLLAAKNHSTAKDPIPFAGRQANLYLYAGNDPVNFIDPDGRFSFLVTVGIGAGIGAAVGYLNTGTWKGTLKGAGVGATAGLVAGTFGLAGVALAEAGASAAIANTVAGVGFASETAVGLGLETAAFGDSSLALKVYGEFNSHALGAFAAWSGMFGAKGRAIGEVVGEIGTELGAWWKTREGACE